MAPFVRSVGAAFLAYRHGGVAAFFEARRGDPLYFLTFILFSIPSPHPSPPRGEGKGEGAML